MLIIFEGTDTTVDPFHWKTLLTFSLSVLSAAFGMSRFFNVGPCRLVPYGKMNVGFIFLVISIATCLVGKGTVYIRTVVQSNLTLRNFLVTTKNFLKVKSSLFQTFNQSTI